MDIAELRGKITDTDYQRSQGTHSVKELYGILEGLIDIAIKPLSDPKFKGVCENACSATKSYKDLVDRLDRNSLSFRFPKDKKGMILTLFLLLIVSLSSSSYTGIQTLSCALEYYTYMVMSRIVL